jgi:hypothetical protein
LRLNVHFWADGGGAAIMAIYRLLARSAFGPEDIKLMTDAYELALPQLGLVDRQDPLTELVAKYVVEAAQTGTKNADAICNAVIQRLRNEV